MTGRRLAPVPAGQAGARSWTLTFPTMELLTANQRKHHMERARITRDLRETAGWLARYQRVPQLDRAHVLAVYCPPDARRRDPANWHPSVKALVDGLVDVGVLPDDDAKHLDGPDIRLGQITARGRMVLVITERIAE